MINFKYLAPETISEAFDIFTEYGDEATLLAGGQSLLLMLRQNLIEPECIIDIKNVKDLNGLDFDDSNGLTMGALVTHRDIETSDVIKKHYPVLTGIETRLASIQIRNWGTVGGNICLADPSSDIIPGLMALGAKLTLSSKSSERVVDISEFFVDYYETILKEGELLTRIHLPVPEKFSGASYSKFGIRQEERPTVGVCASVVLEKETQQIRDVKIVLGASGPVPMHAKRSEEVMIGKNLNKELVKQSAIMAAEDSSPTDSVAASESYKRNLIEVLVIENLEKAYESALSKINEA